MKFTHGPHIQTRVDKEKQKVLEKIQESEELYLLQSGSIDCSFGGNEIVEFFINEQCKKGYRIHSIIQYDWSGRIWKYIILFEKMPV
jgi:hypothetical protein